MNDRLTEIQERCEKATKGPWEVGYYESVKANNGFKICNADSKRNADFIAHAREDIPFLIEEIERLTKSNGALEKRNENLRLDYLESIAERDAAVEDCKGYCASCKCADDCAKHDRNDSGNADWYYGDCEEWEWRGAK